MKRIEHNYVLRKSKKQAVFCDWTNRKKCKFLNFKITKAMMLLRSGNGAVESMVAGNGYGRALMQTVEAFLLSLECPKIKLCTRHDNQAIMSMVVVDIEKRAPITPANG